VKWLAGELFPPVGFIVTNLKWHSKKFHAIPSSRSTEERWIKEDKNVVQWT
jgi:hypothetical protein